MRIRLNQQIRSYNDYANFRVIALLVSVRFPLFVCVCVSVFCASSCVCCYSSQYVYSCVSLCACLSTPLVLKVSIYYVSSFVRLPINVPRGSHCCCKSRISWKRIPDSSHRRQS